MEKMAQIFFSRNNKLWVFLVFVCIFWLIIASGSRKSLSDFIHSNFRNIFADHITENADLGIEKELSLAEINQICGKRKTVGVRIVNGSGAKFGAWPWMAAIFEVRNMTKVRGGGVLINHRYVLTVAHCFFHPQTNQKLSESELVVRLGELDISTDADGGATRQYSVVKLVIHENFDAPSWDFYHDVGLMRLYEKVVFTNQVSPTCLPFSPPMSVDGFVGRQVMTIGWGQTEPNKSQKSDRLMQVTLKIMNNDDCYYVYPSLSGAQLCTIEHGKDTCFGDSGGPLMVTNENNQWVTIGLVSYAFMCAEPQIPTVNVRLTSYIDWITKNAHFKIN